jgi:hypothetical protein
MKHLTPWHYVVFALVAVSGVCLVLNALAAAGVAAMAAGAVAGVYARRWASGDEKVLGWPLAILVGVLGLMLFAIGVQ